MTCLYIYRRRRLSEKWDVLARRKIERTSWNIFTIVDFDFEMEYFCSTSKFKSEWWYDDSLAEHPIEMAWYVETRARTNEIMRKREEKLKVIKCLLLFQVRLKREKSHLLWDPRVWRQVESKSRSRSEDLRLSVSPVWVGGELHHFSTS